MKEFLMQIQKDMQEIRDIYEKEDDNLKEDYYAFYYWVLNSIYHVDLNDVKDHLIIYNNGKIDAFVYDEDAKELYIIRCLYQLKNTINVSNSDEFLESPLKYLFNDEYSNSDWLKQMLKNVKGDSDFSIYVYYYITRPSGTISNEIKNYFADYRKDSSYKFGVIPKLNFLDDIEKEYYEDNTEEKIEFDYDFTLLNSHMIDLKAEQGNKQDNVNTMFFAIEAYEIYKMLKKSQDVKYDLFDENIREYLGTKGKYGKTNKNMEITLLNEVERNRFFYYNNGITIICEDCNDERTKNRKKIHIKSPQIVNGCQTVNTIAKVISEKLESETESEVAKEFKHCLVLTKLYKVNKEKDGEKIIYEHIVEYTNSQTGITLKDFASKDTYFLDIQKDLKEYGFYLIVKQSDKRKFESIDTNEFERMKNIAQDKFSTIVGRNIAKPKDLFIPLDKLLRVLMAFYFDGYDAFKSSASLLNKNSTKYYVNFSKKIKDYFTPENMINLYLMYVKAGGIEVGRSSRYPVPYHLLDFIGRRIKLDDKEKYDFKNVNSKLQYMFSAKEIFDEIYDCFTQISEDYGTEYIEQNDVDYPTMTKHRKIDNDILEKLINAKMKEAKRNNKQCFLEFIL